MKKSREAGMLISVLVFAAVLAVGSGLPVMAGEKESVETETVSEEENTVSRINAQIVSITGNQMTYIRLDEAEQDHESEEENRPERVREAITEAGTMPEGMDPRNVPEGMSAGSMPEGMSMGNRPERMGSGERSRQGASSGTAAGAEVTVYIPVSAPVYTDTGKQKTFSVLRSGDTITIESEQNSMDEEIITAIYLTGTQE